MKCEHCSREFTFDEYTWSRKGYHWCSKTCYLEDYTDASKLKIISKPIMRK